jgi:hypothetical protein
MHVRDSSSHGTELFKYHVSSLEIWKDEKKAAEKGNPNEG